MLRALVICVCSVPFFVVGLPSACGQNFPGKPIHMLTSEPGGGNDFAARLVAQGLTARIGEQVVVENRGAAGGVIAAQTVAQAQPDGYTLLFYGSNIWLMPFLRDHVPYDPLRDFAPVTWATRAPIILIIHPSVAANNVRELIALAKAKPGALNYGAGASGSASQIATELFNVMAGVKIEKISYKGNGPALNALIAGEVQLAFATPGSVTGHIKSGRLKALAVTTPQPSALLPGLPTVAASGLPGYEAVSIVGVFAPAKTPAAVIQRLNREFVGVLQQPDIKDKFINVGVEPVGSTPEEFGATVKTEMTRLGKVIRDAGIRDE